MSRAKLITKKNTEDLRYDFPCEEPSFTRGNYIIQDHEDADTFMVYKRYDFQRVYVTTGRYFGDGWFEVKSVWDAKNRLSLPGTEKCWARISHITHSWYDILGNIQSCGGR